MSTTFASTKTSAVQSIIKDLNRCHANEVIFCPIQNILKDAMREHYQEKKILQTNRYGTIRSIKNAEGTAPAGTNATPAPLRRTAHWTIDGGSNNNNNAESFQIGRRNDPQERISDSASPNPQTSTRALHPQTGMSKNASSFDSLKHNTKKGPMSLNRISACGNIETIRCKNKDGTEKSYKGKLRKYSVTSPYATVDENENSNVDRSSTNVFRSRSRQNNDEGREDIETGIDDEDRDTHWNRGSNTNGRSSVPFSSSHFGKMIEGQVDNITDLDVDVLLHRIQKKKKQVRFCFDHSSRKHADNVISSMRFKKRAPKGIMKTSPLPFANDGNITETTGNSSSICSTNPIWKTTTKQPTRIMNKGTLPLSNDGSRKLSGTTKKSNQGSLCSSDKDEDSKKTNCTSSSSRTTTTTTKVCFLGIAATIAIMIVVLLLLTYFLKRVQNADQERDGGT